MALSKRAFAMIIAASAQSESPLDEEVLREIAEEYGDDPDLVVKQHQEWMESWNKHKGDGAEPLPVIIP